MRKKHRVCVFLASDLRESGPSRAGCLEFGHQRADFALANARATPATAVVTILHTIIRADFGCLVGAVLLGLFADTGSQHDSASQQADLPHS